MSLVDKYAVGANYDRRRKLTNEQKEEIKIKYSTGFYSYRTLAEEYKVSKKCIGIIINPITAQKSKDRIKAHWKDYQLKGEERARVMQEHRNYKKNLLANGEELPLIQHKTKA